MRGVGALDLRFPRKDDEASFKCSLEPDLLRFGLIGNITLCCACAITGVWRYSEEASSFEWAAEDPRTWHFAILLFLGTNSWTQVALLLMRKSRGCLRALNVEVVMLCMAAVNTNVMVVGNRCSISMLFGLDPLDVWVGADARFDESNHVLAVIVMVTYASLFLPFRVHVMWPFPVVTLVFSIVMRLRLGSVFHGNNNVHVVWMTALISFACFGAWRHEQTMRLRWLANRRLVESSEVVNDQKIEIHRKTVLEAGMRTVAESLCDVVVQLDGDLRVRCAEEHLEAFFGRRRMESLLFTEVFADDEDGARFQKLITEVTHEHPSFMNVTISQGPNARRSRTSLLVVSTSGELPSYLVGVTLKGEPHRPCAATQDTCSLAESLDLPGMMSPMGLPAPQKPGLSRSGTDPGSIIQMQMGSESPQQEDVGTQVGPTPTEERGENTSISWEVFGFVCKTCARQQLRADTRTTTPGSSSRTSTSCSSHQRSSRGRGVVTSRCSDIEQPKDGWLDNHGAASSSSSADIFTGFDGEWVSTSNDNCAAWLQTLKIKGEMVVDGRGRICGLQRQQGRILLEGAPMERKDDLLYRYGKSGTNVCFVKVDDLVQETSDATGSEVAKWLA